MRNFKKVIATILSVVLISVSVPVSTPVTSYAAGVMDYTSATDLPLNEMQFITIPGKELKTDEDIWVWYKFHVNPNSKIEVTATKLGGGIYLTTQIFDSKFREIFHESIDNVSKVMKVTDDTTYYLRFKSYYSDEIRLSFMVEGKYDEPTAEPTVEPATNPTAKPATEPTVQPAANPTNAPADGSDIGDTDSGFWTEDDNTGSGVYDDELPVPEIKEVSNNSKSISLEWSCSDTSSIDGYYIYRSNDGKSWSRIATINDTEIEDYEDTDVANGEGYGYIMRSYVDSSQSENSVPEYTCFLSKVSIKSVKSTASKKLTVKWGTNDKASGYQIRISTTKSFTKTTTEMIKAASKMKTTKTIGNLKGRKKYFVQARAYRSYNGEIYYSEWSNSKSLKVKS